MTPGELQALANSVRAELQARGALDIPGATPLNRVCWRICSKLKTSHTENVALVADALWMYPRPLWLVELAGPHWINPSGRELDDTRDIANPGW